jgi:flagellar hook-associated protein 1 FlgK
MSLLSSLSAATRALEAQRFGLDVTGQNIANVNTPGYSRRVIDFAEVPPESARSAGRGVDVIGVRATRDQLLERRLRQELPAERREAAIADALSVIEVALGKPGESIDAALNRYFDAFSSLSQSPASSVARQEVLLQGESVAAAFRDMAGRIALSQRETDGQVRSLATDVSDLAAQIASINQSIQRISDPGSRLHLQDQQGELVRQLSAIIDVDVLQRADGGLDVTIGNGRALVIGENHYPVTTSQATGTHRVLSGGVDITSEISGGTLGGVIFTRDVLLPSYVSGLDELAYEFATQVNTLHAAGVGGDGGTGRNFFTFVPSSGSAAGAAAAITVDAAVAADSSLIAAAGAGGPVGDNTTARDIAFLRHTRVFGGTATLVDTWGQLVYRVGRDAQVAKDEQRSRLDIVSQVEQLRDQVSGVSLDEEAMQLMRFQRAYEANARFFRAVDMTLDTLMQTLAR